MTHTILWPENLSPNDLIPAIVQSDKSQEVLMLGYFNKESFERTLKDGRVCFYSRSKKRLWTKGESSGHFLYVVNIAWDCDQDTLLVRTNPRGPTCHLGAPSCFPNSTHATQGSPQTPNLSFIDDLLHIVRERKRTGDQSSYTRKLLEGPVQRVAKKVGEEAVELAIACCSETSERMTDEAADLLFHYLLLIERSNVSLADILKVLQDRHKGSQPERVGKKI